MVHSIEFCMTLFFVLDNLQRARVFTYEVLRSDLPYQCKILLTVAGTWPSVLCKQVCDWWNTLLSYPLGLSVDL